MSAELELIRAGGAVLLRMPQLLQAAIWSRGILLSASPAAPPPAPVASAPAAPPAGVPSAAIPTAPPGVNPGNPAAPNTVPTPSPSGSSTTTQTTGLDFPEILLTALVWSTLIAALVLIFMPERSGDDRTRIRTTALAGSGAAFLLALWGVLGQIALGDQGGLSTGADESFAWLRAFAFKSNYHLTADGVSFTMLLLSTVVFVALFFASYRVRERLRLYCAMLLVLETAVNGVICANDLLLFVVFWSMQVVPLYVLIRVYGGHRRLLAASRYLTFALISTALLTAGALIVVAQSFTHSSDLADIIAQLGNTPLSAATDTVVFWLFLGGGAIAMGVVPFHTWAIEVQSHASSAVAAVTAGVVLRLGGYASLRLIVTLVPAQLERFAIPLAVLAALSAVWGSLAALAQRDLRRLVAYTTLAQGGMLMLALSSPTQSALVGAVFVLVGYGFASTMLLMLCGSLEVRTRGAEVDELGGLVAQAPQLAGFWLFAALTALGAPLLAGFSAELMLFTGTFPEQMYATVVVMAAVAVTTGALLWALHRVFYGPVRDSLQRVTDVNNWERTYYGLLTIFVLLFGLLPGRVVPMIANGVANLAARFTAGP